MEEFIGKVIEPDFGKEVKIDIKDKKILGILSINSRLGPKKIGRIVRLSKDAVSYRIKQLKKEGIIRGSIIILNPSKIGFYLYTLLLRFENLSEKKEDRIIKFFAMHPFGVWFGKCSGKWDFVFEFIAKDIKHFDNILKKVKSMCGKYLKEYEILTGLNLIKYVDLPDDFYKDLNLKFKFDKKDTSFANEIKREAIEFDYSKQIKLDLIDAKILKVLSEDASESTSNISEKTGIPRDTVTNHLRKMIKSSLIIAFNPIINLTYLKYHLYIILFNLKSLTEKKEKEFLNFILNHPFIGYSGKTSGKYEFQIFLAVKNPLHMHKIVTEFRKKFFNIISGYEPLLVIKDYKYNFLPQGIFYPIK